MWENLLNFYPLSAQERTATLKRIQLYKEEYHNHKHDNGKIYLRFLYLSNAIIKGK
jgi:hypothetical protein